MTDEIPKRPGPDPDLARLRDAMAAGARWAKRRQGETPTELMARMLDLDLGNPAHASTLGAFQQVVTDAVADEPPIPSAFVMGLAVGLALWGPIEEPSVVLRVGVDAGGKSIGVQMEFSPRLPDGEFDPDQLPTTHLAAMAMVNGFVEENGMGAWVVRAS